MLLCTVPSTCLRFDDQGQLTLVLEKHNIRFGLLRLTPLGLRGLSPRLSPASAGPTYPVRHTKTALCHISAWLGAE